MMNKPPTPSEREALRYSGLMGHEYLIMTGNDVRCEIDDRKRAIEELVPGDKLFRQVRRRKFVRIA